MKSSSNYICTWINSLGLIRAFCKLNIVRRSFQCQPRTHKERSNRLGVHIENRKAWLPVLLTQTTFYYICKALVVPMRRLAFPNFVYCRSSVAKYYRSPSTSDRSHNRSVYLPNPVNLLHRITDRLMWFINDTCCHTRGLMSDLDTAFKNVGCVMDQAMSHEYAKSHFYIKHFWNPKLWLFRSRLRLL